MQGNGNLPMPKFVTRNMNNPGAVRRTPEGLPSGANKIGVLMSETFGDDPVIKIKMDNLRAGAIGYAIGLPVMFGLIVWAILQ